MLVGRWECNELHRFVLLIQSRIFFPLLQDAQRGKTQNKQRSFHFVRIEEGALYQPILQPLAKRQPAIFITRLKIALDVRNWCGVNPCVWITNGYRLPAT